uniref:Putative secreted protein n=1 Tax=Anopheles darlingi TaxID=43151 RepID=A0A2M4DME2_ANODA
MERWPRALFFFLLLMLLLMLCGGFSSTDSPSSLGIIYYVHPRHSITLSLSHSLIRSLPHSLSFDPAPLSALPRCCMRWLAGRLAIVPTRF